MKAKNTPWQGQAVVSYRPKYPGSLTWRRDPALCKCGKKALWKLNGKGYCEACKPVR